MYFWQKFHRIPNIRKHMMSICSLSGDFNFDHWIRRSRPVFSHKVTIFLFAIKKHIVRTTVPWFLTCQVGKRGVLRGWGGGLRLAASPAPPPPLPRLPPAPESGSPPFRATRALLWSRLRHFLGCAVICPVANGYLMISKPHTSWGQDWVLLIFVSRNVTLLLFYNELVPR